MPLHDVSQIDPEPFYPGYEINYTQVTSSINITSTTESSGTTIFSPGAVTFDGTPVLLHVFIPDVGTGAAASGNNTIISLFEGATQVGRIGVLVTPAAGAMRNPLSMFYRFTPTAGSHTYTVTASVSSTVGTPQAGCGTGGTGNELPMFARFTKV